MKVRCKHLIIEWEERRMGENMVRDSLSVYMPQNGNKTPLGA